MLNCLAFSLGPIFGRVHPVAINDIPNERSIQDQNQKRELKNLSQVKDKYSSHMI